MDITYGEQILPVEKIKLQVGRRPEDTQHTDGNTIAKGSSGQNHSHTRISHQVEGKPSGYATF
jgi:hypothetical protein